MSRGDFIFLSILTMYNLRHLAELIVSADRTTAGKLMEVS